MTDHETRMGQMSQPDRSQALDNDLDSGIAGNFSAAFAAGSIVIVFCFCFDVGRIQSGKTR